MKQLFALLLSIFGFLGTGGAQAQALIDQGFVSGWNVMVDPAFGNGCLIQTVYEDLSVVRIGYDATNQRSYVVVFDRAWGDIEQGQTYDVHFELDGERFDATATGFYLEKVPGAGVFFQDREFIHAIARKSVMTIYGTAGNKIMAIDLKGSAKALDYARQCQAAQG